MKPHYRMHFHLFDGKTPLWWVTYIKRIPSRLCRATRSKLVSTGGYVDPANAIREAARL